MKKTKTIKEIAAKYSNLYSNLCSELQIALHINKSNLEHIEYLENKIKKLEKNFISEFVYINGLTHITDENCIREYTDIMIKKLKKK